MISSKIFLKFSYYSSFKFFYNYLILKGLNEIRGYAYDLDDGLKLFEMNSHSKRVCVIISVNKEFGIMKGVAKTTLMVHLSRLEDPRTGQTLGINLLRSFLLRYAR
jgi:hypothetical protein